MNATEKTEAKKEWIKPELLVLVRSNPEEAVLTACKGKTVGPYNYFNWCSGNASAECKACSGVNWLSERSCARARLSNCRANAGSNTMRGYLRAFILIRAFTSRHASG